jgi:hypothetical protein
MKAKNLNLALPQSYWTHGVSKTLKSSFKKNKNWFGLLLYMLLWNGFGELVSAMECGPNCSRNILYEQCETQFCERISVEILGERKKVERKKYMKLVKEKEGRHLAREEAKFLVFLIIKMCGVALEFLND